MRGHNLFIVYVYVYFYTKINLCIKFNVKMIKE